MILTFLAIGFAQQMGLHMGRTLPSQNKSLWKRLWWTLYVSLHLYPDAEVDLVLYECG